MKRRTRRELFLAEMDALVPWPELLAVVEPHYRRAGGRGRPPVDLASMLRIYFVQPWFAVSDRQMEDGLYDIESLREFACHIGKMVGEPSEAEQQGGPAALISPGSRPVLCRKWLHRGLREPGIAIVCIETRHAGRDFLRSGAEPASRCDSAQQVELFETPPLYATMAHQARRDLDFSPKRQRWNFTAPPVVARHG
jgi:Transposase domain (DUF772)